jgi:hypothetical protein
MCKETNSLFKSDRLTHQARELCKPFTAAVDMFCKLNDMTDSLQLTEQEKLASHACPACFGPQPPNSTRDQLIICLDGNFQHRHHLKASREESIRTPRIFLENSEVEDMRANIRAKEVEHQPPQKVCSHIFFKFNR